MGRPLSHILRLQARYVLRLSDLVLHHRPAGGDCGLALHLLHLGLLRLGLLIGKQAGHLLAELALAVLALLKLDKPAHPREVLCAQVLAHEVGPELLGQALQERARLSVGLRGLRRDRVIRVMQDWQLGGLIWRVLLRFDHAELAELFVALGPPDLDQPIVVLVSAVESVCIEDSELGR